MSRLKKHINGLFLFYVLSLGLIGISWKCGLIELSESSAEDLKVAFDCEDNIRLEGEEGSFSTVSVLNPSLRIHYSTDGGETFQCAGSSLNISELETVDLTKYPTSLRWLNPLSESKKLKTATIFLENVATSKRSDMKVITSLEGADYSIPVINITAKKSDLFHDIGGLLVLGQESWNQSEFQQAWWFRDANFTQRGRKWEREVNFQYFEEGVLEHNQNVGLRISGNATRGFPQKSFRIYARKDYDGNDKIKHKFFGKHGQKKYESLVIRMSGNDNNKTMFADHLMHELAEEANLLVQKAQPTVLFINGNYWGIYNLRERIDEYFVAKYSDAKKKEVTILEDGLAELKEGSELEQESFKNMIDQINEMTEVSKDDVKWLKERIDLKSYMDYIFFETFYANNDWPDNNAMCYKVNGEKWKWLLNDLDYSLAYPGVENVNTNMFEKMSSSSSVHATIFNKFISNEKFKSDFVERCEKNFEEHLSDKRINRKYNRIKEMYQSEMPNQIDRWRNIESMEVWEANCQANLDFLLDRKEIYKNQLQEL